MKKLLLLLIIIFGSIYAILDEESRNRLFTTKSSNEAITEEKGVAGIKKMICHVVSIEGLSEQHKNDFNMQNGPVKGTDHEFSISIMFNEDRLLFQNLKNNVTMPMYRVAGSKEEGKKRYENTEGGWYEFGLKNNNKDFLFSVAKANYAADYLGNCEVVK